MTRLTDEQLQTARALEDWDTLWLAADPWIKFAMSELRCGDEDALQEARLAAGQAVRSWDPAVVAFSTHVNTYARGAILNWLQAQQTAGVGSRRVAAEGAALDTISLQDPADVDEDGDHATHMDRLTYADIDDSTEFEQLARDGGLQIMADRLLRFLPDEEAAFFRAVTKAGGTRAMSQATGAPRGAIRGRLERIMEKLATHAPKTCVIRETGRTGQENNGQFYRTQHVGNPWADWAYQPTEADVAAGASPRDDAFKWSLGAVAMGARNRRRGL